MAHEFEEYYRTGDTPWDIGKPDFNLIQMVKTTSIKPYRALETGCGTGDNAIWLAQQKFEVLAFDTSETAIDQARDKAQRAGVQCSFKAADILKSDFEETQFGFVFDRGCFHTLDSGSDWKRFAQQVHFHLGESGLWLSLVGSADEKRAGQGPPQRTAKDIVNAVEPYFEVLSLVSGHTGSNSPNPPRAWVCLMKKRQAD